MDNEEREERLDNLHPILETAGEDSATIFINNRDAEALGIVGSKETVEILTVEYHPNTHVATQKTIKGPAVRRDESKNGYHVQAGFARAALEIARGDRPEPERRRPDTTSEERKEVVEEASV